METAVAAPQSSQSLRSFSYYRETRVKIDAVMIETLDGNNGKSDKNSAGIDSLYKGLSVTASEIVQKINELLKAKLPNGIQSLKPEEVTPEATADRIVKGITGLFQAYAKQHPELQGEELLKSFMEKARSGVQEGYDDAFKTLEGLGAFEFDGVKKGVQQTKGLIEEKLKAWEKAMQEELGQDSTQAAVKDEVASGLLSQVGAQVNTFA